MAHPFADGAHYVAIYRAGINDDVGKLDLAM
jgi:hypothetical protein